MFSGCCMASPGPSGPWTTGSDWLVAFARTGGMDIAWLAKEMAKHFTTLKEEGKT